ncbi:MAG: hypothetical protein VW102_04335 [Poseidonia sp.]
MDPYEIMMGMIVVLTPIICWFFTRRQTEFRIPVRKWAEEFHNKRYYLHAMGYIVIIRWKAITDKLNEPMKARTGHWTSWIYGIEGEFTKWVQDVFANDALTEFLNFHYLFVYLFLIYVTTVYFAYSGDRDMTDKVTLNYLLIYALAVPYYLFFNVEVTSSWIPDMDALLYHDGWYTVFYALHDPLDNAVPSLHVAIPFGILMLNYLHVKESGGTLREWRHWPYHVFVLANTVLFMFTILYLGIHWFVDIPLGILIGGIGALFIHHLQPRLRNDFGPVFKGISKEKARRHILVEGIVMLMLLTAMLMAVNYQEETVDERVSFRLGSGDSTFEIIQKFEPNEFVVSNITNLNEGGELEVVLVMVETSVPAMETGAIVWDDMVALGEHHRIAPQTTLSLNITSPKIYHFIVMHYEDQGGDEPVMEVRIINDYGDDKMWQAFMLSLPSLWMTGFVVYRLYRLKKEGRSLIDSTPSYVWASSLASDEEA